MVVDRLVSEPELEPLAEVLGRLVAERKEARQLRVCGNSEEKERVSLIVDCEHEGRRNGTHCTA